MPLLNSVTTPYAEAFLQVANEKQQTEEIVSQTKEILQLIGDSPEPFRFALGTEHSAGFV